MRAGKLNILNSKYPYNICLLTRCLIVHTMKFHIFVFNLSLFVMATMPLSLASITYMKHLQFYGVFFKMENFSYHRSQNIGLYEKVYNLISLFLHMHFIIYIYSSIQMMIKQSIFMVGALWSTVNSICMGLQLLCAFTSHTCIFQVCARMVMSLIRQIPLYIGYIWILTKTRNMHGCIVLY